MKIPTVITGHEFISAMKAAGILPEDAPVQSVIIEASVRGGPQLVLIHVEQVGDDKLLSVVEAFSVAAAVKAEQLPPRTVAEAEDI